MDKSERDINISKIIIENREVVYPLIFYVCGLLLGAILFSSSGNISGIYKSLFEFKANDLASVIISRIGMYLIVFAVTVLLSFCLIGFPIVNIIPFSCGLILSLKISYYYSLSVTGIGYSLLMIIPESSLFLTLIIFTVKNSYSLSKNIYYSTKKSDIILDFNVKSYLKLFIIYSVLMLIIAFINSVISFYLGSVIKL